MVFCDYDMDSVQKQLEELGLSANEVKVYMASLELGAATAQQLAAKAAVVRPTAYVAIGGLVKRGLMSSHTRGKKQFFQGERPTRLLRLMEEEKKKIIERETRLKSLLPGLESLIAITGEKPEIRYYEGWDGLEAMRNMIYEGKVSCVDVIACSERVRETLTDEQSVVHDYKLKKKNIPGRQINIVDNRKNYNKPVISQSNWKIKFISKPGFKFRGEIACFTDHIAMLLYSKHPFGVIVKNKDLAATFEVLFEIAWKSGQLRLL